MRKFLSRLFRRQKPVPTVASYAEVKKLIKEGRAVPASPKRNLSPKATMSWSEILTLSDPNEQYHELWVYVWAMIDRNGYENLTDDEKIVYLLHILEMEVNNGGFDQYFFNTAGDKTEDTLAVLKEIGAIETAELFSQAIQTAFGKIPSSDREIRWKEMELMTEEQQQKLSDLDNKFYQPDMESLAVLVTQYIIARN